MTNTTVSHEDCRLMLNRGLIVGKDRTGGLALRGKGDSTLSESVHNRQMVRNLCASQNHHMWSHFLTFTCNQKSHFGTVPIKSWVNNFDHACDCQHYKNLEDDENK